MILKERRSPYLRHQHRVALHYMMKRLLYMFAFTLLFLVLLLGLPLLGVWVAGYPVSGYLEFPPQTRYVRHELFSWFAFILYAVLISAFLIPLIINASY